MGNHIMAATAISKQPSWDKSPDGKTLDGVEYCPYTVTSQQYDTRRVNPGLDIVLGNAALNGPTHKQKLLDVGCGTGSFLQAMRPHFGEIAGVEYNAGMIEKAFEKLDGVSLEQGSAQALPHPDNTFNVVTINQVVHHFDAAEDYAQLKLAIQECARVLVPGGKLIINTSTPQQQRDAFWWLSLFPAASDKICSRFPPLEVMIKHMRDAGLTVGADNIIVPLHRPLMHPDKYLDGGIDLAFDKTYRQCDSSWEMVSEAELEQGLAEIRRMKEECTADAWLAERDALRKSMGQCTFVVAV